MHHGFRREARKLKDLNPRLPLRYGPASAPPHATRLVLPQRVSFLSNIAKLGREKQKSGPERSASENAAARFDARHCTAPAVPFSPSSSSAWLHLSVLPQVAHRQLVFPENLANP